MLAHPRRRQSQLQPLLALLLACQDLPRVPAALTELLPGRLTACRVEGKQFTLAKEVLLQVWDLPQ